MLEHGSSVDIDAVLTQDQQLNVDDTTFWGQNYAEPAVSVPVIPLPAEINPLSTYDADMPNDFVPHGYGYDYEQPSLYQELPVPQTSPFPDHYPEYGEKIPDSELEYYPPGWGEQIQQEEKNAPSGFAKVFDRDGNELDQNGNIVPSKNVVVMRI